MKKTILWTLFAVFCAAALHAATPEGWTSDFPAAQKLAAKENKHLYVLFTGSDWCPYCVKLQKNVLSKDSFKKFAKDNLVLVYVDFPRRSKADDPAANKALAEKYGVRGFPTAKIMTPDGKVVTEIVGAPAEKAYMQRMTAALVKVRKK